MSDKKTSEVKFSNAAELYNKIESGEGVQIVDVREVSEYEGRRISGAILAPLSRFEESSKVVDRSRHSYIICQAGKRAGLYAEKLIKQGYNNCTVLEGGLKAWIESGYPVEKGESRVWSLERQVRFAAGLLVLLGVVLSLVFNPMFLILSGIVGAGLVFAAVTDTCGMAMLLARMPWNQAPKKSTNT